MRVPTLEEWRRDPRLRAELVRAAHRQRNEEMSRWFARLGRALKAPLPAPRWLAALGPQGRS
jgi:hypothetical protein